ncbi:MAG TPA: bifunctional phosphopantothenoylcysteine decarboxylase/phosphopantothenate--cysteine ligase CoaBC [Candidatus Polarisedimenticolaceae bacterium]|nr:bifunctional phosphopantothenoylcysteine decarboxylase/phosphopantothenate--cysteine ligase CoaBC [Candidatus Polarisedimenticolaceae bacterium]
MLIALGVSGGIAAYKTPEIVRALDRAGAEVQVLLTQNACEFVTPLTLQTLSRNRVLIGQYDLDEEQTIRHIELTRRVSALVVAPATANFLAKMARGVADDLLSTFYTAVTAPVVVAPAMNTRMWLHPATQANLAVLRGRGVTVIEPESGWLAEGETGQGRMAEPGEIARAAWHAGLRSSQLAGKKIVVTAGPTREPIDPVRFVSNRSSGRMGHALAAAAARRGARVVLVSGPVDLPPPYGVERVVVETSAEMRRAVLDAREGAEAVFMAAAVSDFIPRRSPSKIKKREATLTIELERGPDILSELGQSRCERVLVGFAAETESLVEHAREKLERKRVDFIVANDVSRRDIGMEADDNAVTILSRDGGIVEVPKASKAEIADVILDRTLGAVVVEEPS